MKRRYVLQMLALLSTTTGCINTPFKGNKNGENMDYIIDSIQIERKDEYQTQSIELGAKTIHETISATQPGKIRLSIKNNQADPFEYTTGPIPPFGVLMAESINEDKKFLLWNDRYQESSHVHIKDDNVSVKEIAFHKTIKPDSTETGIYKIKLSSGVSPGKYSVSAISGLGFSFEAGSYSIRIQIVEADTTT